MLSEEVESLFLGIGTILNHKLPTTPKKYIFGSGWAGDENLRMDSSWKIYGVRGPLTAKELGLPSEMVFSDPGLLIRDFVPEPPKTRNTIGWMPHHRSIHAVDWATHCPRHGLHFINPEGSVERVLHEISQCELLLSEAMHGVIVADSLRIPWIPVHMFSQINEFKWWDWCKSMDLSYNPVQLPPIFETSPRPIKRCQNGLKRFAAPTPLGKDKWHRLPLRKSSPTEISQGLRGLRDAPETVRPQLSRDPILRAMIEQQFAQLTILRNQWADDHLQALPIQQQPSQ
ncbi:polysaccharide pyruvyl transferase family protein [Puniceicoccus vermicola]